MQALPLHYLIKNICQIILLTYVKCHFPQKLFPLLSPAKSPPLVLTMWQTPLIGLFSGVYYNQLLYIIIMTTIIYGTVLYNNYWYHNNALCIQFRSVHSLSCVRLFATPWTAARQSSLSITNSWSLLKLISIASVMQSNHLVHCHPLFLLPSVFPSIRVFSDE